MPTALAGDDHAEPGQRRAMPKVVISEFMDEAAIAAELAGLDVVYDPGLVDRPEDLAAAAARADALIVRNRTQVRGALGTIEAQQERVEVCGRNIECPHT